MESLPIIWAFWWLEKKTAGVEKISMSIMKETFHSLAIDKLGGAFVLSAVGYFALT